MHIEPILLTSDNFTPLQRTPWAGTRILERYKPGVPAGSERSRVGESWEISMGPEFPSRCAKHKRLLTEYLAEAPNMYLGAEARAGRSLSALLVKLLDAGDDLSVQIHPRDDYAGLAPDEAGKPESWYVLDADPGAGVYLGLRPDTTPEHMAKCLKADDQSVAQLLNFIPLSAGDFILVEAGMPHAIGKGITVVEPQVVLPGRKGVTYRYWDWNRRYDDAGQLDPSGSKRTLHIEHALAVTDWDLATSVSQKSGPKILAHPGQAPTNEPSARLQLLCGPSDALLHSTCLQVARVSGTGALTLPAWDVLRGLTVVGGKLTLPDFDLSLVTGQSAVLPAALGPVRVQTQGAHALMCAVVSP